jgi:hypothetical protein
MAAGTAPAGGCLLASEQVVGALISRLEQSGYSTASGRVTEPVRDALALARWARHDPKLPLSGLAAILNVPFPKCR